MKRYTIIKKPAGSDWSAVPAAAIDNHHWCPAVDITAQAQVCYDDDALYVRLSAQEAHIRAEHTGPMGMPCEDSCLEFFFSPAEGDQRYLNLEFNPNASLYLGIGTSIRDLVRLLPEEDDLLQPKAQRIDGGWEIVYRIPTEFIRRFFPDFRPVSGASMRGNFYKCGDLTVQEHYMAWNPVTAPTPCFHYPPSFGLLVFE